MNKEINLGNLIIPVIKPQKGKDYYTESEKQELISIVTDNVNAGVLPQEQTRQSNEIIRQNNEQTRQAQETIRQTNETNRQTAETERESAENTRQSNESSRVSAEQTRTQTFNNKMDAVDTAIAGIHTSQNAYDQNATAKTSAFNENATSKTSDYNTNATNKTAEYNENASTKIAEYDAHIRDYEAELATKVDKVIGKGLSSNDFTNEEKAKLAELHNYDDTELSERVDDIEQEQTEQNTNISTNATNIESLQEENENLKKIVSQLPQVEGQGTKVTLENTIEAPFTKFDVKGNSVQDGSPSPDNEVPILSAGDNENIWNGEIERGAINGDGLDVDATNRVRNVGYYELNKGTYTLSYKGAEQSVVYIFNANKVKVNNPSWENGKSTFTLEENGYIKYALKQSDNREMNVNDVSEIKLEKGNKASGYSPYGMGSINEKISNGNNFDGIMEQGDIPSYNGQNQNNTLCVRSKNYITLEPSTAYFFERFGLLTDSVGLRFYDKDKNYLSSETTTMGYNVKTKAFTSGNNVYYMRFTDWTNNLSNTYMLSKGNKSVPYVPHEEQDYSIFVQQPIRSIRDVRDCFVKKSDGWYERHFIAEGIFNPYNCGLNGGGTTRLRISMWGYQNLKETSVKSKYFPSINGRWDENNEIKNAIYGWNSDGVIGVNIDKEIASTLDEFKTWASRVGLNFYYIRKNPLDLPCTPEQVEQIENKPSTYKDFTIIQSQDETPAYLEVSGIRDIDTMFDKVTNAIVSLGGNV